MYAVFRAGGKQYRASKGERLKLEKFAADEGASVEFDEVLLVGEGSDIVVGSPLVDGTTVSAKVLRQGKSGKVSVTKFRRRQNYLRQHTHRQWFTEVEITGITGDDSGQDDKKAAKKADKKADPKVDQKADKKPEAETGEKTASESAPKAAKKKSTKKKATKKASAESSSSKKKASKASSKKKTAKKSADE